MPPSSLPPHQPRDPDTTRSVVPPGRMSEDEYGWSSGDDEYLVAAPPHAPGDKRKPTKDTLDRAPSPKRAKPETTSTPPSPSTVLANKVLKQRFGLDSFRLEQEKAITRILDGGSALVVFPTGGGKSLCYQVSLAHHLDTLSNVPRCLPLPSVIKMSSSTDALLGTAASLWSSLR